MGKHNLLLPGERILFEGKITLFPMWLPIVFAFVAFIFVRLQGVLSLMSLIFGLLALGMWIRYWIIYLKAKCFVTNKRVIISQGEYKQKIKDYYLSKIDGVEIKKNYVGSFLSYGDVGITVSGIRQPWIYKIKYPELLSESIYQATNQMDNSHLEDTSIDTVIIQSPSLQTKEDHVMIKRIQEVNDKKYESK